MINERKEELAALYVLEQLEGVEKLAFEAELATKPALRDLVRELREASAGLALAVSPVEPPAGLRDRILISAQATPPKPDSNKVAAFPVARFVPWLIAAALAMAATWLTTANLALRGENNALRTERELAGIALQMARNQVSERTLLAEQMINSLNQRLQRQEDLTRLKVTALAALAGNSAEAKAIAVWDPDRQSGLLTIEKLPALAATQDYQLWLVDPAYPTPVSGGVFTVDDDGRAVLSFKGDKPITTVNAFAVSLEKKGGVPKAEGPIMLLGKL